MLDVADIIETLSVKLVGVVPDDKKMLQYQQIKVNQLF